MKKGLILLVVGVMLIVMAGTALAATVEEKPIPGQSREEYYQEMYEACHGPNGFMTRYYNNGDVNGALQQGYGMMGF